MSSPRNDLVKNCRVHPTHWLISTQVAGVGYFIGIYLFKQVAKPAEIDWSCPSLSFLVLETAVGVLAYDAIFYGLHLCGNQTVS